jgi:site-specific recombinase XerD
MTEDRGPRTGDHSAIRRLARGFRGSRTRPDIEVFMSQARSGGKAASTQNTYIQTTKALFRWAVKKGYLSRNPAGDSER